MSVANPNWSLIPDHMRQALEDYLDHGLLFDDFLTAVLENDLKKSVWYADIINQGRLLDYVNFLYNDVPAHCWGSRENVASWVKRGGLSGSVKVEEKNV